MFRYLSYMHYMLYGLHTTPRTGTVFAVLYLELPSRTGPVQGFTTPYRGLSVAIVVRTRYREALGDRRPPIHENEGALAGSAPRCSLAGLAMGKY